MDREHRGRGDGNRYRVEVVVGIVGYRVVYGRVDDDIWRNHKDGITVGCRSRSLTHADIATGTSDVLDVELFSETFRQFLCRKARQYVRRTGGSVRNDHTHRPRRIGLRQCSHRETGREGRSRCELEEFAAEKFASWRQRLR